MNAPHPLPPEDWPDAAEARASLWFSPIALGRGVTARQRTWVPAMVPWRATEEGFVTQDVLAWYERFARGKPGVLVVEATGIRDVKSGPLLRIGHDRYLPGLRDLVATVRRASHGETKLFIQVIDFLTIRRRPEPATYFGRYLAVDAALRERFARATEEPRWRDATAADDAELRDALLAADRATIEATFDERQIEALDFGYRERVTDVHVPHVAELPRVLPGLFADAAARAKAAGFDGVELHFAHAYTMASFLSRRNDRADGYGGSREGRVRLPLEVLAAVRARVGDDFPIAIRFLGDEAIDGGSTLADTVFYGECFARASADVLSVSKGGKFEDARQPKVGWAAYPYTGPSGHECMPTVRIDDHASGGRGPFGRNVPLASAIRANLRAKGFATPVVTSGGILGFRQAERILRDGHADLVAAARQSLADPDWFRKILLGRGAEVRRCTFTNYCEGLDQQHKQVTCKLWDRVFDPADPAVARSTDGRRRLVAPDWEE